MFKRISYDVIYLLQNQENLFFRNSTIYIEKSEALEGRRRRERGGGGGGERWWRRQR